MEFNVEDYFNLQQDTRNKVPIDNVLLFMRGHPTLHAANLDNLHYMLETAEYFVFNTDNVYVKTDKEGNILKYYLANVSLVDQDSKKAFISLNPENDMVLEIFDITKGGLLATDTKGNTRLVQNFMQ